MAHERRHADPGAAHREPAQRRQDAPSRDPEAHWGIPDVDEDAGDAPSAAPEVRERFEPFIDSANQNPEFAARAAGPWPSSEEAPAAADRSSEDAMEERGLQPRTGPPGDNGEGT
jgi:hypothetical protein